MQSVQTTYEQNLLSVNLTSAMNNSKYSDSTHQNFLKYLCSSGKWNEKMDMLVKYNKILGYCKTINSVNMSPYGVAVDKRLYVPQKKKKKLEIKLKNR